MDEFGMKFPPLFFNIKMDNNQSAFLLEFITPLIMGRLT